MATYLQAIRDGITATLWPTPPPVIPPPTLKEVFKGILLDFTALSISEEECLTACAKTLKPEDYNFSETSQPGFDSHLQHFEEALQETSYLEPSDSARLRVKFRRQLGEALSQTWPEIMAKSFYDLRTFTHEEDKDSATERWADRYFLGLVFLRKWEDETDSMISREFVEKHLFRTSFALRTLTQIGIEKRMEKMGQLFDKDPTGFKKRLESVKHQGNPDGADDKEIEQMGRDIANVIVGYWPEIEDNVKSLESCIRQKFTQKWSKE